MKIIHTADWHLGQTFYNYNRYKEHAVFLDWLCCTIKERGTDVLLIAGDVFDNPNPSAEAQKMYYNFLRRVTGENEDLKIVIIAGNHDSAARIEAPSPLLDIFNVHVSGVLHYVDGKRDYDRMIVPLNSNAVLPYHICAIATCPTARTIVRELQISTQNFTGLQKRKAILR